MLPFINDDAQGYAPRAFMETRLHLTKQAIDWANTWVEKLKWVFKGKESTTTDSTEIMQDPEKKKKRKP